jgi:acetolactate synthase-1/2/3 large subunit
VAASTPRQRDSGSPVDPEAVIADVQRIVPPEAIMISDVGNFSGWLARYYRFRQPGTFIAPTSGAMGYGLPAAIAAKMAHPDRPVVAMAGDGSFMMTLNELETAVRERTPVVVLVFDNRMYGTIRMHQEQEHPGRVVATSLGTPDLALTARSFGALGFDVRDNAEFAPALKQALAADVPTLIHLRVDPNRISVYKTLSEISRGQ